MMKIYGHYGLSGKFGKLDVEEGMELVSDSNDFLMERIVSKIDCVLFFNFILQIFIIEQCTG